MIGLSFGLCLLAAPPVDRGSLTELTQYMVGRFSSADQAKVDPEAFKDIRLEIVRIWPRRSDGVWLYVEQAAASSLDKPYRQRVYHLTQLPDGRFSSVIFEFKTDPLKHAGGWKVPAGFDALSPQDLVARPGCTVFLVFSQGVYSGSTQDKACLSTLRGARYATTKVTITPTELHSWDQGWSAEGNQVWGAAKAGYIFTKKP